MKATIKMYGDPNHSCDIMVCTIAIAYGINLSPTQAVIEFGALSGISPKWQMDGRTNRTRDESKTGRAIMVVTTKKYRKDAARAREKLPDEFESSLYSAAMSAVNDVQAIYNLALDCRLCLRLHLDTLFGGSQVIRCCAREDVATCGNCDRMWRVMDQYAAAHLLMQEPATLAAGVDAMTKSFGRLGRALGGASEKSRKTSSDFPKPRVISVIEMEDGASWSLLPSNKDISTFLQKHIIQILRKCREGMKGTRLAKEIAQQTGVVGLKEMEVLWCLWWFMVCGYLEEDETVKIGSTRLGSDGMGSTALGGKETSGGGNNSDGDDSGEDEDDDIYAAPTAREVQGEEKVNNNKKEKKYGG